MTHHVACAKATTVTSRVDETPARKHHVDIGGTFTARKAAGDAATRRDARRVLVTRPSGPGASSGLKDGREETKSIRRMIEEASWGVEPRIYRGHGPHAASPSGAPVASCRLPRHQVPQLRCATYRQVQQTPTNLRGVVPVSASPVGDRSANPAANAQHPLKLLLTL